MPERKHITRGLRFTLTAVYAAVFTLLLIALGLLFRQNLNTNLNQQAHDDLDQNWAVVKAYLRIAHDPGQANYHVVWQYDHDDPDESSDVASVQSVIFIADSQGREMDASSTYESLGLDKPDQIRAVLNLKPSQPAFTEKHDPHGAAYLIRAGYVLDEDSRGKYYVAIGKPLAESRKVLNQFTLLGLGLIPPVILAGCVMGWIFAGRALTPVLEVARTAQRISGSNLSLRIPERGSGDELDRLIETFNRMIERLETSFNQIRQFSTDVSHELRTPITVVRGQLEVALFTAQTVEQYREAIVNSLADIERLSQIVRALLLLSQAETGQLLLQKQPLDLVETAENVVEQFQIPADGGGVTLQFAPHVSRCAGEFDRVQIERMLSNLLSNAIKFTPAGGTVRVVIDHKDQAEIRVEDTGMGIAPEHLPHIFDRFYRVPGAREQASPEKGLGLGLSFVAWIARAHGGAVDVRSEPGKGTTFTVRLPLTGTPEPPIENSAPYHEIAKSA